MSWLLRILTSSIGKKQIMAVTGLSFCSFLIVHLIGNLTIYGGHEMFNSYVEHLHAFDPLIKVSEIGLLTFALTHISIAAWLFLGNLQARPIRYAMKKRAGGRTLGSSTMPYTGLVLICFIVTHLLNFHFVDHSSRTVHKIVTDALINPLYAIFYVVAVILAAVHIKHGFWSAFQTVGANHPKYMPFIETGSILFSLMIGAGFGLIPIFIFMTN